MSTADHGQVSAAVEPGTRQRHSDPARTRTGAGTGRDFGLLWAGQSASLLGDQFMVLALPLLSVGVLGTTAGQAALLPFALYFPFLLLGLPAGAIVDRLRCRPTMFTCDMAQSCVFGVVAALAGLGILTFPALVVLVFVAGCASVFFQVSATSYLPALFTDPRDLHRGNARLSLSESVSQVLGPMAAGPLIGLVGVVWAVAGNSATFAVSILSLLAIRHREQRPATRPHERGWLLRDIGDGLRFVHRHPQIEPVISCGAIYVGFLSMVEATLVLYCRGVLHLHPVGIGVVVGAAAAGFPIGNVLSSRMIERFGAAGTLVLGAAVSVVGLVAMPIAGSLGSVVGLVAGSVVHSAGEGAFGPTSLTLRQTESPAAMLGRVNSVQRFLLWGMIPVGSLLASLTISVAGLSAALWVGGLGTILCLPALFRRGIRTSLVARGTGPAAA